MTDKMFDATNVACILTELQEKHKIILEPELLEDIYDHYTCIYQTMLRKRYSELNMFELMVICDVNQVDVPMNKTSMIDALYHHS